MSSNFNAQIRKLQPEARRLEDDSKSPKQKMKEYIRKVKQGR